MEAKEAKLLGLKVYNTGRLCKKGHSSERYTNNRRCIECSKEYQVEYLKTKAGKDSRTKYSRSFLFKAQQKRYRQSELGKATSKVNHKKYADRFPNAINSRYYYRNHKHEITVLDFCEKCKYTSQIEAHHHDYDLPLDVTFLCKKCHEDWHMNKTPLNREYGIFNKKDDEK